MKYSIQLGLSVALLLVGCKAAPTPLVDTRAAEVASLGLFGANPHVRSSVPTDGQANVRVGLNVQHQALLGFSVQALPKAWNLAAVSLHSNQVNEAYNSVKHLRTAERFKFTKNRDMFVRVFSFPPLRPGEGYEARVYLQEQANPKDPLNDLATLTGSKVKGPFALRPGPNVIEFNVVLNDMAGNDAITESASGNLVGDNLITQGDLVTLATGMMKKQPGVHHLHVYLQGECYDEEAPVLIQELEASDSWDTFAWDTATDAADFEAEKLNGGEEFGAKAGTIVIQAYNERNELLGKTSFPIQVYGKPEATLNLMFPSNAP